MSMQAAPAITDPSHEEEGQPGRAVMEQIPVSSLSYLTAALKPGQLLQLLSKQPFHLSLLFPTYLFQHSFPSLLFQAPYCSHFAPQTLCSGFASPRATPQALAALQLTFITVQYVIQKILSKGCPTPMAAFLVITLQFCLPLSPLAVAASAPSCQAAASRGLSFCAGAAVGYAGPHQWHGLDLLLAYCLRGHSWGPWHRGKVTPCCLPCLPVLPCLQPRL